MELDQTEVGFHECNLLYNIMIINLAYVTIEEYKVDRVNHYKLLLRENAQNRIMQENELHGFFKFVLNFYKSDF